MIFNYKDCVAFITVAETGSFDLAARKLCLSAAAITLRVQQLERQIGQTLILRERPCRVTHSGEILLEHLLRQKRQEENVLQLIQGKNQNSEFYKIIIGTNADSLETWLLPAIAEQLIEHKITIQLRIDDQDHTHQLMESGYVNACISAESQPMTGCHSEFLFTMRYQMVCTPEFKLAWFKNGINRDSFRRAPAVIFNDKDHLHETVLLNQFGLPQSSYPYHYVPSSKSFVDAIHLGLGYGMVPELQIQDLLDQGQLICLLPEATQDVDLYWHHWKQQSPQLKHITDILMTLKKQ